MATPLPSSVICPVLIGRAAQLNTLTDLMAKVSHDMGPDEANSRLRVALISGEAGIGKTRLVHEAKRLAPEYAMAVLEGRCFEQDHAIPYAPVADLLSSFCRAHSQDQVDRAIRTSAPELIKVCPELASYFPEIEPSPLLEPDPEKRRIFQALTQFLRRVGLQPGEAGAMGNQVTPLLLIFEDLHWCDDLSLDFLLYLVRHTTGQPLLLIGTFRDDELHEPLKQFLVEINRMRLVTESKLASLSLGEADQMMHAILSSAHPLGFDLLEALFHLTEGNPFFIEEALKAKLESGEIFRRGEEWNHNPTSEFYIPRTLQYTVQRRLKILEPEAQQLISLASVMGRRFNIALLQPLMKLDDANLTRQLHELVQAQLIVEESLDTYAFRHALTREAIYQNLLGRERQNRHGRIAAALENLQTGHLETHLNELAYHFFEAGVWLKAFEYAQRAGMRAQTLDATRSALIQFTRALEAAERAGIPAPLATWRARAQAHQTLGHLKAARADYENILQAAQAAQNRQAEWQSFLDLGFLWTGHDYHRAGDYFQLALDLARELGDSYLLAKTLNRIGNWRFMAGQPLEGRELHAEALEIFKTLNDPSELAGTFDLLGISNYGVGDLFLGSQHYAEAISTYRKLGDRQGLIASLCAYAARGGCYITMTAVGVPADLADLIREGEEAVQIAHQMGWRPNEAYALSFQALSLGPHGEFKRAMGAALQSLAIATELNHEFILVTTLLALGALSLDLLAPEKAKAYFEQADALAQDMGAAFVSSTLSAYLALTYLALNELASTAELFQARLNAELAPNSEALRWLRTAWAEYQLKQGQAKPALLEIEQIIAAIPRSQTGGISPRLWLLRGQALHHLKRWPEAEQVLRDGLASAKQCHLLPLVWRIQIALGQVLHSDHRATEAQGLWMAARAGIHQLAAEIPDEPLRTQFIERALDKIPNPTVTTRQLIKAEFGGLTARERDVANLIVQGRSNLEIAESLVLSRRTVEVHVANIMAKLNVRTRAQIAVWVVERGA